MRRALARYGGVLLAPRATVAALPDTEGQHDGVWMSLAFVAAVGVRDLIEGAADVAATRDLGGVLMLLSTLGRSLLVPILALVAAEAILGRTRAHRRGLCLVPMVLAAAAFRELPMRTLLPWPYASQVVLVALAVGMALWVRPAVPERVMEAS